MLVVRIYSYSKPYRSSRLAAILLKFGIVSTLTEGSTLNEDAILNPKSGNHFFPTKNDNFKSNINECNFNW